ncbi:APC family permease [Streptacidiphilus sp. PB12-B1b]|uniref:APC family permease n=1 Tax=Streptacidiphilus sp. PB12-B1b TaxID=2705012 RepID=UPI0015FD38FD|nr:APC family permease [Streptacidiphilus sp. PB12-B1b]QMU75390.1 APC family permease [Streptacidiphilus sp. PB12-B1b]
MDTEAPATTAAAEPPTAAVPEAAATPAAPGEDGEPPEPGTGRAPRSGAEGRDRLTALGGLAALSLDAMASVAYGPEAIVVVLAAAGAHGLGFTLPVTIAIAVLLAVLTLSYRQVIAAFPDGGGSYAVARTHLGRRTALVAAGSLVIDYVLNVAVSVTAGVAALTSAFPGLYGDRLWLCLAVLALVTAINLRGIAESARAFMIPTAVFVISILTVVAVGLFRHAPVGLLAAGHTSELAAHAQSVGVLLLLRAFASGCSALTGVEAIANAVPSFRAPGVKRAQHTEMALGGLLGAMLIGLAVLIGRFHLQPVAGVTVLAQLTDAALGHGIGFYVVQFATVLLLALAANTSFGGLPVLLRLLARDNHLPHVFALRADHQVYRHGVLALALASAALLVGSGGNVNSLVPLFAIGVFVGFTVCQVGMVRHWHLNRIPGWRRKAALNGFGALLTAAATVVETLTKFTEGAWIICITLPLLVLLFSRIRHSYERIGEQLGLGRIPEAPVRTHSLVVVPVGGLSRLTREAVSAAVSLGDEVVAVTVVPTGGDDEDRAAADTLRAGWEAWQPGVPLVELPSERRELSRPLVACLRELSAAHAYDRVTVLIAEVEPAHWWTWPLHNQRGALIARAVRRGTEATVCRLRLRLDR